MWPMLLSRKRKSEKLPSSCIGICKLPEKAPQGAFFVSEIQQWLRPIKTRWTSRILSGSIEIEYSSAINRTVDSTVTMKPERDLEKVYSNKEFVQKLRRLADCIEAGEQFEIQIAGERVYVPVRAEFSIEHERTDSEEEIEFQIKWSHPAD